MNVVLLEDIRKLGSLGDCVDVRPGYARNYLFPQNLAVRATPANLEDFERRRAELEALAKQKLQASEARQEALEALDDIVIFSKASDEGKLYGSVSANEIAAAIEAAGVTVARREVILTNVIRSVGEYDLTIQLAAAIAAEVRVIVKPE